MPMKHTHRNRNREQGFTLVVIAALFVAFSVIAAVAVERNTTVQMITRRDATIQQLTRLSNAIIEYSVFNKNGTNLLYPCPATLNLLTNDAGGGFGAAVADCQNTTGDSGGYTSTGIQILNGTNVIRGMVPVLTLSQYGIGINDAFDPWNNRIMYVVNRKITLGSTDATSASQPNNPIISDIRTGFAPNTPPATDNLIQPDFILISYGRDGVGGYKRTSSNASATAMTPSIACTNGTSTQRLENCDTDDVNFVIGPTYTGNSATAANYFDDILTYYRQ